MFHFYADLSTGILINTSSREGQREKQPSSLTFNLQVEAEPSDEEPELQQLEEEDGRGDLTVVSVEDNTLIQ